MKDRHRHLLGQASVDAYLVLNAPAPDPGFIWSTGLVGHFEGCLSVLHQEGVEALVPPLEEALAREGWARVHVFRNKKERMAALKDILSGAGTVGVDLNRLTVNAYQELKKGLGRRLKLQDISGEVERARQVKDDDEIRRIRDACAAIGDVYRSLVPGLKTGRTETSVAAEIVHGLLARGATASFEPIVGTNANGARPHHRASLSEIAVGPLLLDLGARKAGYCSDITRMVHLGPAVAPEYERAYWAVHDALERAVEAAGPGVPAKAVDTAARQRLADEDLAEYFIHTTGHGLGIEVHDPGRLSQESDLVLEPGMVVTVEPGVYFEGKFGIRLEHDVLITARGREVLTPDPLELVVIGG